MLILLVLKEKENMIQTRPHFISVKKKKKKIWHESSLNLYYKLINFVTYIPRWAKISLILFDEVYNLIIYLLLGEN